MGNKKTENAKLIYADGSVTAEMVTAGARAFGSTMQDRAGGTEAIVLAIIRAYAAMVEAAPQIKQ